MRWLHDLWTWQPPPEPNDVPYVTLSQRLDQVEARLTLVEQPTLAKAIRLDCGHPDRSWATSGNGITECRSCYQRRFADWGLYPRTPLAGSVAVVGEYELDCGHTSRNFVMDLSGRTWCVECRRGRT